MRPNHRTPLHILGLLLLGSVVFLPCLGQERRFGSREIRHAEIAREIAESGDYAVPHLFGRPYIDKPPLFNWSVALLFRLTGRVDFFVARLPSALCAIAAMLGLYILGKRWYSARAGIYSAVIWCSTWLVVEWSRFSRMDMMMACLIFFATLLTDFAASAKTAARRNLLWCAASFVMGCAVLSKGPYAVIFFGIAVIALWRARTGRWIPPLHFAPIFVGIVFVTFAAWAAAAELSRPGHVRQLFEYQFGHALVEHPKRIYLYLDQLLIRGAPWWLFAPGAVWWVARRIRRTGYDPKAVPAVVFAAILLALTIARNKRVHYLLPLMPFWALFLGGFIDAAAERPARDTPETDHVPAWAFRWPLTLCLWGVLSAAIAGALLLGLLLLSRGAPIRILGGDWSPDVLKALAVLFAAMGAIAASGMAVSRGRRSRETAVFAALILIVMAAMVPMTAHYYTRDKYDQEAVGRIASAIPAGAPVAEYGAEEEYLCFKLNRPLLYAREIAEIEAFLRKPGRRYVIVESGKVSEVARVSPRRLREIATLKVDKRALSVLRSDENDEPAGPKPNLSMEENI